MAISRIQYSVYFRMIKYSIMYIIMCMYIYTHLFQQDLTCPSFWV